MVFPRPARRAQSLVEFALALPVFLFIVAGLVDLGRAVYCLTTLEEAAREGARKAIYTTSSDADIRRAVRAQLVALGPVPDEDIAISPSPTRLAGESVTVSVYYEFRAMAPLVGDLLTPLGFRRLSVTATRVAE